MRWTRRETRCLIDRVEMEFVADLEVSLLKVLGGEQEICGRPCKYYDLGELVAA